MNADNGDHTDHSRKTEGLDALQELFKRQLINGESPRIEDYLTLFPESHRGSALLKFVAIESQLLSDAGKIVSADNYIKRFPENADSIRAAIEPKSVDPSESKLQQGKDGLDRATDDAEVRQTESLPLENAASKDSSFGNYRMLQKIGEGGMGQVWMAEQRKPVNRRVAVKIIKPGMDSRQVIARFEAERQALAMMDHQNIAKVLDAGTTETGQPYFAMELVKGLPITEFCDKHRLDLQSRLGLFVGVCQAVQHAHQKGIIHRDIKPSNIMVAFHDNEPIAKVIDFGLAKALQQQTRLTDKTLYTEFGKIIGTIQYMSPEQAQVTALDVDTRTDVYSLGVLLYELLTGFTPIDRDSIREHTILEILQWVREKDPPKPSTRLSDSGDAISGITEQRRTDLQRLSRMLKGDLDWIVMKAIEKDRSRRYETVAALSDDVGRFLTRDPVVARPPSPLYNLGKFVSKNRTAVMSSMAFISILLSLIVWIVMERERSARFATEVALLKQRAIEDAYQMRLTSTTEHLPELDDTLKAFPIQQRFSDAMRDSNRDFDARRNAAITLLEIDPNDAEPRDFLMDHIELLRKPDLQKLNSLLPQANSTRDFLLAKLQNSVTSDQPKKTASFFVLILHSAFIETDAAVRHTERLSPNLYGEFMTAVTELGAPITPLLDWIANAIALNSEERCTPVLSMLCSFPKSDIAPFRLPIDGLGQRLIRNKDVQISALSEFLLRRVDAKVNEIPTDMSWLENGLKNGQWFSSKSGEHRFAILDGDKFIMGTKKDDDGSFIGDAEGFIGESQVLVMIPRQFAIATKETTLAQLNEFESKVGLDVTSTHSTVPTLDCPAYCDWHRAVAYCNWLSRKENLVPCYKPDGNTKFVAKNDHLRLSGYRLPTEAEWEFACRAGTAGTRFFGESNAFEILGSYAWYSSNSGLKSQPVGQKQPNPNGLFDIYGNAWEWCDTPFHAHYEPRTEHAIFDLPVDPTEHYTLRGGARNENGKTHIRSAVRAFAKPDKANVNHGFRIARTLQNFEESD